jgi:chromosomal replication initiator protein
MLTAEQFTSYFMGALHGSGLPSFRMKYRGVGLLAIDDIQFFAGKRATVVELLHTIDTLLREGKQVVLSADRPADQLMELGPELVARLQGGLSCPIEAPDFDTRLAVVNRLAVQLNIVVPAEVCAMLAGQITTHARALAGALRRLALASDALGRQINVALAEETLADLMTAPVRQLRLADIEAATCDVFSLEPNSLQSTERGKRVDCPRMLAMWLARKHTRAALSEIGQYFGRRSHSTVISASKKIDACLHEPSTLIGNMRLDELVRRVEQRLGTG